MPYPRATISLHTRFRDQPKSRTSRAFVVERQSRARRRHDPHGASGVAGIGKVRLGSFATELGCPRHVRFTPVSDRAADIARGPFRAKTWSREFTSSALAWEKNGRFPTNVPVYERRTPARGGRAGADEGPP